MRRSVLLVPVVVAALAGLAGCAEETAGDATPGADGGSRPTLPVEKTETDEPAETSTSSEPESGTASLDPCELLTSAEQASFGVGPGTADEIGSARVCQWQASEKHTIGVSVFDDLGLADVQSSGDTQQLTVGAHAAVRYTGGVSTCAIAIEVTDSSRVDVSGVAGGDMTKACAVARRAAELVEPKLP